MPKLKVFQAHLGFFDTVVAAPSRKAALQAWGSRQDLFRDGTATVASDPDAIRAALEKPGIVLKRLSGSKDAFVEQPPLPRSPGRQNRAGASRRSRAAPQAEPGKLRAAEKALARLRELRTRMREEFEEREEALQREMQKSERECDRQEAALQKQLARVKKLPVKN